MVVDENGFLVPDMTKSQMQLSARQVEARVNTPLEEDLATPRAVRHTHSMLTLIPRNTLLYETPSDTLSYHDVPSQFI